MARQPHRISNDQTNDLDIIFGECSALATAYDLKNKLFDILHTRNQKHESFLETVEDWCEEAKSKGIDCLDDFSDSLKGYKVVS